MRFSEILAASLVAPLVASHSAPGAPKIFGLAPNDAAALRSRNFYGGHAARAARFAHGSLHARQGGADGRCGKEFGCATCAEGYCCSTSGYCGQGQDYCQAPDSQFNYGPGADANKVPSGGTTRNIARPQVGSVPYGGEGIYFCKIPGQVAITYDDGPYIYTNDVLDLFASYGFRATFFVTGINLYKSSIDDESKPWPAMLRRMISEGHQVASHTWSHQDLSAITSAQRYEQMVKLEMAMSNVIGKFPTYMRPPYSSCTEASGCQKDMAALGYHVSNFNLDTDDYNNLTPDKAAIPKANFADALDAGDPKTDEFLAIAHDIHMQTAQNLTVYMLEYMKKKGYVGVTIGECLGDSSDNWYRSPTGRVATSSVFTPPACASTRASSSSASASRTSSAVVSTPTGVSQDSTCGPAVGLGCIGFSGGSCCSEYGYCGDTALHCGTGCQAGFGNCGVSSSSLSSSVASTSSLATSSGASKSSSASSSVSSSSSSVPSTKASTSSLATTSKASSSSSASSTKVSSSSSVSPTKASSSSSASSTKTSSSSSASSSTITSSSSASSTKVSSSSSASSTKVSSSSSASSTKISSSSSASSSTITSSSSAYSTKVSSSSSASSTKVSSSSASSPSKISSTVASTSSTKSTSVSAGTSTRATSSSLAPTPTPGFFTSTDGRCGGFKTCVGFGEGECCSKNGWCGNTAAHCGTGCNPFYGKCSGSGSSLAASSGIPTTKLPSSSPIKAASSTPVATPSSINKSTSSSVAASSSSSQAVSSITKASSTITASTPASSAKPTGVMSPNGSCGPAKGYHCLGYYEGSCCSQYGYCGSSTGHCKTKCQPFYGKCT